ncbi:MAG: hypothetical protein QG582_740 [Candidatus Thermoplasmatota archaeon]|nr:hypothetical protein [Candidatus Thermoplasmatota archaeon]
METKRRAAAIVVSVAVLVFLSSFTYEVVANSGWQAQELGFTPTGDGFYQMEWNSKGELQLAYLGSYGPYYALLYGQRVEGEWNLTYLSRLFYEHEGASLALDSQDRACVCTSSYDSVMNVIGPHIVFATNFGGIWECQVINVTDHPSSAKVAVDAQDRVHLLYSRDTYQSTLNPNSSIVDMTQTTDGWNSTVLKESNTPYVFYSIVDVDRRPDGSIGMIYKTSDWLAWDQVASRRLNYSIVSSGSIVVDTPIIASLDNYSGEMSLCHDSEGTAYISGYRKNGEVYNLCYHTNAGGEWMSKDVAYSGGCVMYGMGTAISVSADGSIHMGYFAEDYDGTVANHTVRCCTNAGGTWNVRVIDDCNGWSGGESIAIATDSDQDVHIVYYRRNTEDYGDTSVTVYSTSELDPDRYGSALYDAGLRTALVSSVALVIVMLTLHRRKRRKEHQERMDVTGLFEN